MRSFQTATLHIDRKSGVDRGHRLADIINEIKDVNGIASLLVYAFDESSEHPDTALPKLKILEVYKEFNLELARRIIKCFPNIEKLRLTLASVDIVDRVRSTVALTAIYRVKK